MEQAGLIESSIQFIYVAHFHKLQICLRVLHIGSGKTPKQPFMKVTAIYIYNIISTLTTPTS